MGIAMTNPHAVLVVGSMESAVAPKMASVASPMGLAKAKLLVASTLLRDAGQQDDIVVPQLAPVALPIGMATTSLTEAQRWCR
jgi:hypothetical protein